MSNSPLSLFPGVGFGQRSKPKAYLQLLKIHLCLYISLSAILGHVTAVGRVSFASLLLGGSVLILSFGSAILNNIQDREYDRAFERTAARSLPMKIIPLSHATFMAVTLIGAGLFLLFYVGGWICVTTGVLAVAAYNGLYTPLKKRSLLAIIPGTISGMLPVMIGWSSVRGMLVDPVPMMQMIVLGLWQVPHFFIILLKTRPQMSFSVKGSLFPSFVRIFSKHEIRVLIILWTSLYSLAIFCLLMNRGLDHNWASWLGAFNALTTPVLVAFFLWYRNRRSIAFAVINLSMLTFLGTGILDKLFA